MSCIPNGTAVEMIVILIPAKQSFQNTILKALYAHDLS